MNTPTVNARVGDRIQHHQHANCSDQMNTPRTTKNLRVNSATHATRQLSLRESGTLARSKQARGMAADFLQRRGDYGDTNVH